MRHVGWMMGVGLIAVAGQAEGAEHVVRMTGNAYEPAVLEAKVGDVVRFVNQDQEWHEVFVPTAGFALDLGKQEHGQETTLTLVEPGTFEVECVQHLSMLLTVRVAP